MTFRRLLALLVCIPAIAAGQPRFPLPLDKPDLSGVTRIGPEAVPLPALMYDALVDTIIQQVNLDSLVASVRILSGEDSVMVGSAKVLIRSRGGQTGSNLAAEYLKQRLSSYDLQVFDDAYSTTGRNIYARQTGYLYPEKEYLICAHYDATSSNGADDNASGSAGVLEAARVLSTYDSKYTVVYAFWDEEEIGLVGSNHYAAEAASKQEQIEGVINLDMLGWDGNKDGLADIHTQNVGSSNSIADLLLTVKSLYSLPLKPVIYNPGTWQSDHSSFWNQNYGAVLLIEAYYGGDLNPYFHANTDSLAKFNLPFFHAMSRLSVAALSTLLGVSRGPVIASIEPDTGYQTYSADMLITGLNTHFNDAPGTTKAWLSKDTEALHPDSIRVDNNAALHAYYRFPAGLTRVLWDVNVETATDGVITIPDGFTVLPRPAIISVSPETLNVTLAHGETKEMVLAVTNSGGSDLEFSIRGTGQRGFANYGLRFNGQDTYVECADDSSLNIATSLTIEAWVHAFSWFGSRTILAKCGSSQYRFFAQGGAFVFDLAGVVNGRLESALPSSYGWHHVAGVYDFEGQTIKLYQDGAEVAGHAASGRIALSYTACNLGIGTSWPGAVPGDNWFGILDEVRIWNVARSQSDIQEGMNRQLSGGDSGLVAYWAFDEGSGTTTYDCTQNANDGTLSKGMVWSTLAAPLPPGWFSMSADSGQCAAGSSMDIRLTFDATKVDSGDYRGVLTISHNDPMRPPITIPVHLTVSPSNYILAEQGLPRAFALFQNYPNPFNPTTTIGYTIGGVVTQSGASSSGDFPDRSRGIDGRAFTNVRLAVYDILGREVAMLVNEKKAPGRYEVEFDASGLSSGIYFYKLQAGSFVETRKLVLLR